MAFSIPRVFRDFDVFPSRFDRLVDEMVRAPFESSLGRQGMTASWLPSVGVYENDDEMLVDAELPGISPSDLDIRIDNNVLTVSGERKVEDEAKRGRAHREEFCYGTFARSIPLPATIDQEHATAEMKDGVLRVHLPKAEKARARQIQIQGATEARQIPAKTEGQAAPHEPDLVGAGSGSKKR